MAGSENGTVIQIPAVDAGRRPRVLILGGGFAGLNTAISLAKLPVDVTIVVRRNHHTLSAAFVSGSTGCAFTGQHCHTHPQHSAQL